MGSGLGVVGLLGNKGSLCIDLVSRENHNPSPATCHSQKFPS